MTIFTHLHLHSDRSSLDSTIKIPELVSHVKELGMKAVAVTDHGVMAAAIQLYTECIKAEIKPILGCEIYLSPTADHTLREAIENQPKQQCYHLTLLAQNEEGVKDLYELSSRGFLEGFYYKPRISLEMIRDIGNNIIVLGACAKGPVSWNLWKGFDEAAFDWARKIKEYFPGKFWLEIMDHGIEWQAPLNLKIRELATKLDIPLVATNDSHFLKKEDHSIHSLMMCMQMGQKLSELTMKYPEDCYVKSPEEMVQLHGEALCEETQKIVDMIDIKMTLGKEFFPEFSED